MNPEKILMQHLRCDQLPDSLSIADVLEAIRAAAQHSADQTSDFDSERIANLRKALHTIAVSGTDPASCVVAKRALITDEEYQ